MKATSGGCPIFTPTKSKDLMWLFSDHRRTTLHQPALPLTFGSRPLASN